MVWRLLVVLALALVGLFVAGNCLLLLAFSGGFLGQGEGPLDNALYIAGGVAGAVVPPVVGTLLLPGARRWWLAGAVAMAALVVGGVLLLGLG